MLHWTPGFIKALISLVSAMFFVNHFAYLSVGRFDYQYNMKTNIITGMCYIHLLMDKKKRSRINKFALDAQLSFQGIATGTGWIVWYLSQRKNRPYSWKIMLFQILVGISLLLEVNDFPPLFWVLDAHALWHLSTVLPTVLLYRYLEYCAITKNFILFEISFQF